RDRRLRGLADAGAGDRAVPHRRPVPVCGRCAPLDAAQTQLRLSVRPDVTDQTIGVSASAGISRNRFAWIAAAIVAAAALYFLPELLTDYWLRTLISAAALTLASLSVSLLFGQLGMVSLAQYGLLGVGGW